MYFGFKFGTKSGYNFEELMPNSSKSFRYMKGNLKIKKLFEDLDLELRKPQLPLPSCLALKLHD